MTFWTTNKKTHPQKKNRLLRCLACEASENKACSDGCWESHHESFEELFLVVEILLTSRRVPWRVKGRTIESVRSSLATPDNTILACESLRVPASHFMTLWKKMFVPPVNTALVYKFSRMSVSRFMTLRRTTTVKRRWRKQRRDWKKDRLLMDTSEEEARASSSQNCARTVSPDTSSGVRHV